MDINLQTGEPIEDSNKKEFSTFNPDEHKKPKQAHRELPKEVMTFFMDKGYTKESAAAITARLVQESKLNHGIKEKGNTADSFGIAQWRKERLTGLGKFHNKDPYETNMQEQLQYMDHELNNKYSKTRDKIKGSTNIAQSWEDFTKGYERPKDWQFKQAEQIANAEKLHAGKFISLKGDGQKEESKVEKATRKIKESFAEVNPTALGVGGAILGTVAASAVAPKTSSAGMFNSVASGSARVGSQPLPIVNESSTKTASVAPVIKENGVVDINATRLNQETLNFQQKVLKYLKHISDKTGHENGKDGSVTEVKTEESLIKKVMDALLVGGALAALAGVIASALIPEETKKFIKDATEVAKSTFETIVNSPKIVEGMGKPGQEHINQITGKKYESTGAGKLLQSIGDATIGTIRSGGEAAAGIALNLESLKTPGQEYINPATGKISGGKTIPGKILQGIGGLAIEGGRGVGKVAGALSEVPWSKNVVDPAIASASKFATGIANAITPDFMKHTAKELAKDISDSVRSSVTKLTDSISSAIKNSIDGVINAIKHPFTPTQAEQNRLEGKTSEGVQVIQGNKGKPAPQPDNIPRDKSGKPINAPKIVPATSAIIPKAISPKTEELTVAHQAADNLLQKKADGAPTIITNNYTTQSKDGGMGDGGVRIHVVNQDSTAQGLNFISNINNFGIIQQ